MCNLYSQTRAQDAMRQLFEPLPFHDRAGNLPAQPEIYPDQLAPVIRAGPEGLVMTKARWVCRHRRNTSSARRLTGA